MPNTVVVVRPDPSSTPHELICERAMAAAPSVLYPAWTTDQIGRWFAAPGTVLMKPEVNVPFFFETHYDGQRHPHYGRFLRLEPDRLVEMTWVNAAGTRGAETVLRVELVARGGGTLLRLNHHGFLDEESSKGHAEAWPEGLELLDRAFQ